MLHSRDWYLGHHGRIAFEADKGDGTGGGNDSGNDGASTGNDGKSGNDANPGGKQGDDQIAFTPEQQKHIEKLIGNARKEGKTKAEQDAIAKKEEDRIAAELKLEEEKGNFSTVRTALETERDKYKTDAESVTEERNALAERIAEYEARDLKRIETGIKDLPDDLKKNDPILFYPEVPLSARLAWLETAQADAAKLQTDPVRGNGRLPDPLRGDPKADEAARRAQAQLARNF